MNQSDRDYYAARAATARDMAQRAADPAIAALHAEFATRYDLLAEQTERTNDGATRRVQAA